MADRPSKSSVRSALAVRAAVDDLLDGEEPIDQIEILMREAKALEPRMLDETIEHLRAAYPPGSTRPAHDPDVPEPRSAPTPRPVADSPQA